MDELKEILSEAARFRANRANLAQKLKDVDVRHNNNLASLEKEHAVKLKKYEEERQTALSFIEAQTRKDISDYTQMKNSLQEYLGPVRQWCSKSQTLNYTPNPLRVNENELNKLVQMLQEQGIMAWIKRTFKLDGYSSRTEMAFDLYCKIEDACAYCNEKIATIESKFEDSRNSQVTETRRKIAVEF